MSSQIASIADAMVTLLNAGTFTQEFTATRKWIPKVDLEDLGTICVTVVPKDYVRENETRISVRKTFQVDIGVQKRLETTTNPEDPTKLTEVDGLMGFMEEIANFFSNENGRIGGAAWVRSEIPEPLYDQKLLDEDHIFFSRVTVTLTRV